MPDANFFWAKGDLVSKHKERLVHGPLKSGPWTGPRPAATATGRTAQSCTRFSDQNVCVTSRSMWEDGFDSSGRRPRGSTADSWCVSLALPTGMQRCACGCLGALWSIFVFQFHLKAPHRLWKGFSQLLAIASSTISPTDPRGSP